VRIGYTRSEVIPPAREDKFSPILIFHTIHP